ncbi:phosphate-starvation-inducible PsiE family protein [Infirmifilum lucidum]|uniref:Phosphate-starvation-inducible PsiE family protein n=1 Tax=Infirmifilum lucidum TaxID=2776706 RepID=A0A7L9FF67_9CREN|nr:phosphate-starvation-inducible PsiE family protein [Infirmifilum lucidum]QOJ78438.1 phosphate-starvation-inducible PsiE family protein [Infirmifilum lucidum]
MERYVARFAGGLIVVLEALITVILAVAVIFSLWKLGMEAAKLAGEATFDRQHFVTFLDESLLMIVAVDLMRTLVGGIVEKKISVIVVLEAALIFIVREMITMELKIVSDVRLVLYVLVFLALFASWFISLRSRASISQHDEV